MASQIRVSNSFSEGQVLVLAEIITQIQRGGTQFSVIARNPDFPGLARKAIQMRTKLQEKKKEAASEPEPEDSPE